jgi:hypothetical protein
MRRSISFAAWVAVLAAAVAASAWWRLSSMQPPSVPTPKAKDIEDWKSRPPVCWWSPEFVDAPRGGLSEFARGELARLGLGRRERSSVNAP